MNASGRPNTCKSNGNPAPAGTSGARVRNTYATYPLLGHNLLKDGLIPHGIILRHLRIIKDLSVKDGHAPH